MRIGSSLLVLIALIATGLLFRDVIVDSGAAWLLGSIVVLSACRSLAVTFGFWSVPSMFLLICSIFHVGLAPFKLLGLKPDLLGAPLDWLETRYADDALLFSALAICSFAVGATAAFWFRNANEHVLDTDGAPSKDRAVPAVAALLVFGGVSAWLAIVVSRLGVAFFLRSYDQYLAATAEYPLGYTFFTIGLGMMLLGLTQVTNGVERVALAAFGFFALVALPIGLRGEVLFPMVLYAVSRSMSGRKLPSPALVLVASVVLLGLVGGIKEIRQTGLQASATQISSFSPANGLGELGYTLRTVAAVNLWQASVTPPRLGETYLAPVERGLSRLKIAEPQPAADFDTRLMNVEMRGREGNIGGSILAEAYRNFEWLGLVVLFMAGCVSGALAGSKTLGRKMLAGLFLLLLLQHVRNSFTPLPLQAALGLSVVLFLLVLSRRDVEFGGNHAGQAKSSTPGGPGRRSAPGRYVID